VRAGLIGLAGSGKTTLFEILTGIPPSDAGKPENRIGVVRFPDARLERLGQLLKPRRTTPATLEVVDPAVDFPAAGPRGRSGESDPLAALRAADALLLVVRAFANDAVPHPLLTVDPARDLAKAGDELMLADLAQVESRLERIEKLAKVGKRPESAAEKERLERLSARLHAGEPLRALRWSAEEERALSGFAFLSQKPLVVVFNTGEAGEPDLPEVPEGAVGVRLPVRAECEVARLPEAERAAFRDLFHIPVAGHEALLAAVRRALDLISFFTAGPPEVRAWHLSRGGSAVEAASRIHTDLGRGFVRAEVLSAEQLLAAGSWAAARERGWLRTEGREYLVQDGDVLHVLHTS
jgi:hypothetical protein